MDFTIEIDNRDLGNLKLYHKECGSGEVGLKKIRRGKIKSGLSYGYAFRFTSVVCKKCKKRLWVSHREGLLERIEQTAIDGQLRLVSERGYLGRVFQGDNPKKLPSCVFVGVYVVLKKFKEITGQASKEIPEQKPKEIPKKKPKKKEKLKKTIRELKEKLAKAEQSKKEVEKFYCPDCGAQLLSIESFCSFCGANIEDRILEIEKISTPNK